MLPPIIVTGFFLLYTVADSSFKYQVFDEYYYQYVLLDFFKFKMLWSFLSIRFLIDVNTLIHYWISSNLEKLHTPIMKFCPRTVCGRFLTVEILCIFINRIIVFFLLVDLFFFSIVTLGSSFFKNHPKRLSYPISFGNLCVGANPFSPRFLKMSVT